MSTVFVRPVRVKPKRTIAITLRPSAVNPFYAVRITESTSKATTQDTYFVQEFPSPLGRAFEVRKVDADEPYHVLLASADCSCECKGFLKWDHCRHIEGLKALLAKGDLQPAEPGTAAPAITASNTPTRLDQAAAA
jgi:hypothetical protein